MVKHISTTNNLSSQLINEIGRTENNSGMTLNIALNYASYLEIANTVKDKLWFTNGSWPDFKYKHLENAIKYYNEIN